MSSEQLIQMIKKGDVSLLREFLQLHPEILKNPIGWDGGQGFAVHCATWYNKSEIIDFLINEKKMDANHQRDVNAAYTPLHHAAKNEAYDAAAMLLKHGANPLLKNSSGETTIEFCKSERVKELLDPDYLKKQEEKKEQERQKKIAGTWKRTTAQEVIHEYELPEHQCRLMDIFNFEQRFWRAIAKDPGNQAMTQNILFFDDIPDKEILYQAINKLKELGGKADEAAIERKFLRGKSALGKNAPSA